MNTEDVLFLLLIVVIAIGIWLFVKLRNVKKKTDQIIEENRRLIADNAILEDGHLKFQLQPHTINNILANLKVFASKLHKGMDSLSETLDYILYHGKNNLVSIKEEMEFMDKYIQLHDLFVSEIDSIDFNKASISQSAPYYSKPCIPHLITAYFLENAFKHGDTNHPEFLKIEVALDERMLKLSVVNRIKNQVESGREGIGLKNMKRRLELLQAGKFEINQSCDEHVYVSTLVIEFGK